VAGVLLLEIERTHLKQVRDGGWYVISKCGKGLTIQFITILCPASPACNLMLTKAKSHCGRMLPPMNEARTSRLIQGDPLECPNKRTFARTVGAANGGDAF
jgi:hypothetical protein